MRAITGGEETTLQGRHSWAFLRIEVQDAAADWIDYSDYVGRDRQFRAEVSQSNDERIAQATVMIRRDDQASVSLSPLMNADIDLGRGMRVYGARVAPGATPEPEDYKLLLEGRVDRWEAATDPLVLTGRDMAGVLVDRWVEQETDYGDIYGVPLEEVMQQIIDDWAGGAFTLVVDPAAGILSEPYIIFPYTQTRQSVWDALSVLAELIGYVLEYRWSDDAEGFELTLAEPAREGEYDEGTGWEFGPDDYYDVDRLELDVVNIRTAWSVRFYTEDGTPGLWQDEDTDATAQYGRLWAEIEEGSDSPIKTLESAQMMGQAALADTASPTADHQIRTDLWWPAQLGDIYRHGANDVHYDVEQDFALAGFRHVFENGSARSFLHTRGKPAGSPNRWRRRATRSGGGGGGGGGGVPAGYDFDAPSVEEVTSELYSFKIRQYRPRARAGYVLMYVGADEVPRFLWPNGDVATVDFTPDGTDDDGGPEPFEFIPAIGSTAGKPYDTTVTRWTPAGETWAALRGGVGNDDLFGSPEAAAASPALYLTATYDNLLTAWSMLTRVILRFDTRALAGETPVASAKIRLEIISQDDQLDVGHDYDGLIRLTNYFIEATTAPITAAEYQEIASMNTLASDDSYQISDVNHEHGMILEFTLNAAGIAHINDYGASNFCVRFDYDIDNVEPSQVSPSGGDFAGDGVAFYSVDGQGLDDEGTDLGHVPGLHGPRLLVWTS